MTDRASILFLCTGNSARSIMAEAIANQRFGDRLRAVSAGSDPKPRPHPLALETLRRSGLTTEGLQSKSWERFADEDVDLVVTLCGSARERCPRLPGAATTVHWGLPDPPAAAHPESAFASVFDALVDALDRVAQAPGADLVGLADRAAEAAEAIARRFDE